MKRASAAPCLSDRATGMALSVLAEIGRMLETLTESGQADAIDLRSLPLSDVDRAQLEEVLGRGEVRAELDIAGESERLVDPPPRRGQQDRHRGNLGVHDT